MESAILVFFQIFPPAAIFVFVAFLVVLFRLQALDRRHSRLVYTAQGTIRDIREHVSDYKLADALVQSLEEEIHRNQR